MNILISIAEMTHNSAGPTFKFIKQEIVDLLLDLAKKASKESPRLQMKPVDNGIFRFSIGSMKKEQFDEYLKIFPDLGDYIRGALLIHDNKQNGYFGLPGMYQFWKYDDSFGDKTLNLSSLTAIEKIDGTLVVITKIDNYFLVRSKTKIKGNILEHEIIPRLRKDADLNSALAHIMHHGDTITLEMTYDNYHTGIVGKGIEKIYITSLVRKGQRLTAVELLKLYPQCESLYPEVLHFGNMTIFEIEWFMNMDKYWRRSEGMIVIYKGKWCSLKTTWWKTCRVNSKNFSEKNLYYFFQTITGSSSESKCIREYAKETKDFILIAYINIFDGLVKMKSPALALLNSGRQEEKIKFNNFWTSLKQHPYPVFINDFERINAKN